MEGLSVKMELDRRDYSTQEVADLIEVHKNTVLNWIRSGKVPDVRRDWKGYRVWNVDDIERMIEFKNRFHQLKLDIA